MIEIGIYDNIMSALQQRHLITPYLENAILAADWPHEYWIRIDSGPYYGLDDDGQPDGYFHPSSHALAGERQLFYLFHPAFKEHLVPESRSLMLEMASAMGTALHGVIQTQMVMSGLCKPENIEVEFTDENHHVKGRTDMVVDHPREGTMPVELKTKNPWIFNQLKQMEPEWEAQLNLALDILGYPFGVVLVMSRDMFTPSVKEFRCPRNDKLLSEIYSKFAYVRECIEQDKIPPRACCAYGSETMRRCPARFVCWLSEDPKLRPGSA